MKKIDVIIIGAGAAGLMCGIEAGKRGRKVLILDKSNKPGKKILMSGGGRCNFTNLHATHAQFLSHNPHFCKSALSRYTQWDFIAMVERHKIAYFEKTLGQLFCKDKASLIVDMLLAECKQYGVAVQLNQAIHSISSRHPEHSEGSPVNQEIPRFTRDDSKSKFITHSNDTVYQCDSLVVASGGLSIPTLGSSPFGFQLATQFGLNVHPTRAGLVPFTLHTHDKERFERLAGISVESMVSCNGRSFEENILFTHRGLSGPAILQISSYWLPGDAVDITLLPQLDLYAELLQWRNECPDSCLKTVLANHVAKRLLLVFYESMVLDKPLKQFTDKQLLEAANVLQRWSIKPNATEGYRTAEVTLGGVDCNEISSQTFEARKVPGLFFVGEVLDVSGWLGGYNFQWAWASGWAAGQVV